MVNIGDKISHGKCNFTPVYQQRVKIVDDLTKKKTTIENFSAQIHFRYIWKGLRCLFPSSISMEEKFKRFTRLSAYHNFVHDVCLSGKNKKLAFADKKIDQKRS